MSVPSLFIGRRRSLLLWPALFLGLFLFPQTSLAFENPQRYYDWGASNIRVNQKVLGASTSAETQSSSSAAPGPREVNAFKGYILGFGANFSPGNPFYFVKTFQENAALVLTFNPAKREEVRLRIAGERLKELEDLADRGQTTGLNQTSRSYQQTLSTVAENLSEIKKDNPEAEKLLPLFEEETSRHSLVLEEVSLKVPESAKSGLDQALAASHKVLDEAADLSGRPALPIEVLDRIQALKAQGLLSEEEAQKLVLAKTRGEARAELNKFAKEGIFPEADIVKLNETGRSGFEEEFKKLVELKKFLEVKRLEEEKPDEEIIKRVQDFAKTYKAGEMVPSDLRRFWVPMVRLEELQNTIRPDLIDSKLLETNKDYLSKYNELVERIKPRVEDIEQLQKLAAQNPNVYADPFYERLRGLAEKFGTTDSQTRIPGSQPEGRSCPSNSHWASVPYMPGGGYCVPNITYPAYQPEASGAEGKTPTESRESVCPEKYHRNYPGGPCLPDTYFGPRENYATYTPGYFPSPVFGPVACPNGYYWSGTTCSSLERSCGFEAHWVPEPGSQSGGYCVSNTTPAGSESCLAGQYKGPGGFCIPSDQSQAAGECSTKGKYWVDGSCKDSPPPGYGQTPGTGEVPRTDMGKGFSPDPSRRGDSRSMTPSRESQEAACRAGGGTCVSWVNGACGCERNSGDNTRTGNVSACPSGQYRGPGGYCISSYNAGSPGRESQEAACRAGGGTCVSWVNGACGCERPGGQSSGTGGGTYYGGGAPTTPPSGYGSCSSGQYWNGSSCQSSTYTPPSTSESPEQACLRGTGCSWTGSSCNCSASSPTTTSTSPSPEPPTTTSPSPSPTPAPSPEPAPAPSPTPEPTPTTNSGGGSACASGSYWNGSACVAGSQ